MSGEAQRWDPPQGGTADQAIAIPGAVRLEAVSESVLYAVGSDNNGDRGFVRRDDPSSAGASTAEALIFSLDEGANVFAIDVAVAGDGSAYVTRNTDGRVVRNPPFPNGSFADGFLAKYDADLQQQWIIQFDQPDNDVGQSVAVDGVGNVYVSQQERVGLLGNPTVALNFDATLRKLDPSRDELWSLTLGQRSSDDRFTWLYANASGDVFAGYEQPTSGVTTLLKFSAPKPGDFDGNGIVDNGDLNLLLGAWGDSASPLPTGWDGFRPIGSAIDNAELNGLLGRWGDGFDSTLIPEPASGFLAITLIGCAAAARRRAA